MVARQKRGKASAKMRLKNGRTTIPDDIIPKSFPEGCPIKAADVKELLEGPSLLEQLCAVKAIGVSSMFRCILWLPSLAIPYAHW
jgi:hypothetical protein